MNIVTVDKVSPEKLSSLMVSLSSETPFMLLDPSEAKSEETRQEEISKRILASPNVEMFIALNEDNPIGFCVGVGGIHNKDKQTSSFVIGVLKKYHGKGVSQLLFNAFKESCMSRSIHRIELTVMENNQRAISFYKKMGFVAEGLRRQSLLIEDRYVDEVYMSLICP
jgi:RimJ/RimL family protein N-acetyltransferase